MAEQLDSKGVIVSCTSCRQRNRLPFEKLAPRRCGKCQTALPTSAPIEAPEEAFNAAIATAKVRWSSISGRPGAGRATWSRPSSKVARNAAGLISS